MEVESLPTFDLGASMGQDKIAWDVTALLNMDDIERDSSLDLQSVPTASPDYLCLPNDSPLSSPLSSPYSSPELSEIEVSEMDMLFADSIADNPDLLPELEKILSSVDSSIISPPASPSDQVTPTRSSKKRKTDDGKVECADGVCLPRDQLLTMTSSQIEDYVSNLKSQRNLSVAEEKELKRQRRLIKNREYASQSRSRKKQYVDELEKALEDVRAENTSLKQQVGAISDENKTLRKQINAIATTIKKSASLSSSSSGVSSLSKLTSIGAGRVNNTKISACLMAIMLMAFTFSIFWDKQPMFQYFPTDTPMSQYSARNLKAFAEKDVEIDPFISSKKSFVATPNSFVDTSLLECSTVDDFSGINVSVWDLRVGVLFDVVQAAPLIWNSQNQSSSDPMPMLY